MGYDDKIKNAVDVARGKAKELVGEATDSEELQAEGKLDQASAKSRQAVEAVNDELKDTIGEVRDRLASKVGELGDKVARTADSIKQRSER
ncbi:MAG: CsbD family protein [Actinobacteria bacterium]|nr:MAG: CsbD family protein [Actinomycetota bacterium]